MNLPEKSNRQLIMIHIERFINQFSPGDQLRTESVIKYVHTYYHRYIYGDTILRYMRDMRARGVINYTTTHKHDRIIRIIEPGAVHSL